MKILTLPIIRKAYANTIGKTAIECKYGDSTITVFCNGDQSADTSILCNVALHEVGDTFMANRDSKTTDEKGKPIYLKGQTVTRQKSSEEFKSFVPVSMAAQFAQSASAFGLQLVVQM